MKRLEAAEIPIDDTSCQHCGADGVHYYHAEELEGYLLADCPDCGRYSEIFSADTFAKVRTNTPRRTGDPSQPWSVRVTSNYKDIEFDPAKRKDTLIERIFKKRNERY